MPFEEVFDILAIRIIFRPKDRDNEIAECYAIYAALTQIYKPHPSRFRDWLSTPKANGYQALHNTFMSHQGKWIEVQIRSDRMDDVAEGGFAAHWKYKSSDAQVEEKELDTWVNSIKEILDDPQPDTLDLLDTIKLNLFASELNVFTPKGDILTLPQGATVLDFAFAIHSMIGSHCIGGKVNHRLVPLSHRLANGDQIEILTSQSQNIQSDWMNYVTTGKARGRISAALRRAARECQRKGEGMLREFIKSHDLEDSNANIQKLKSFHQFDTPSALYLALGEGKLVLSDLDIQHLLGKKTKRGWGWRRFVPFLKDKAQPETLEMQDNLDTNFVEHLDRKVTLTLSDEVLNHCELCSHCHPIKGDEVMGYINRHHHLELHRRDCTVALKHKTSFGNNIIATEWDNAQPSAHLYEATLSVEGIDSTSVLQDIAQVFVQHSQYQLQSIQLNAHDGIFQGTLGVRLSSTADVHSLCHLLLASPQITKVNRTN